MDKEQEKQINYPEKARDIFNLLNDFRQNPKKLVKKLETLRTYLNKKTKVLAQPGKMQIQMMEGDSAIRDSINFLKALKPLDPLEWDDHLAASALFHVNDIGPRGDLSYASSDGTEPEDRISRYGTFTDSLGENIDFGPNDALGVIISLCLDDGEEDRPHRDNLFKTDYRKVGIACGPHKSEYQMCVMDFAYDFEGFDTPLEPPKGWSNYPAEVNIQMNKEDIMDNSSGYIKNNYEADQQNINNTNPIVKLSLEPEEFIRAKNEQKKYYDYEEENNNRNEGKANYGGNQPNYGGMSNPSNMNNPNTMNNPINNMNNPNTMSNVNKASNPPVENYGNGYNNEFDELAAKTKALMGNLKVVEKKVEIVTKITYVYEDGSTKVVTQTENHDFKV
ncbi:MAG: CAP domain-containing protein [archaeon]|nr:CAP domain-containing protein [archaeon]